MRTKGFPDGVLLPFNTVFQQPFAVGTYVEVQRYPGAIFRVVEHSQDYDAFAIAVVKFVGPRRGIPPRTKGGLDRNFRICKLRVDPWNLVEANPMLVLAAESGG